MNKYKILIVEDDRGLNQGIAMALREESVTFYQAYSLGEAQELWRTAVPDMVLLDINLPDGSGYDFLRDIRKKSEIPVLLITANDLEVDEVTGFSLGADDFYEFIFDEMKFYADGQEIVLSKTEQKLLRLLTANPGQTLPRERLLEVSWSDGAEFVEENALSVAVNRLRKKLEIRGAQSPIRTVYVLGYAWDMPMD